MKTNFEGCNRFIDFDISIKHRLRPFFLNRNLTYLRKEFDGSPSTIQQDLNDSKQSENNFSMDNSTEINKNSINLFVSEKKPLLKNPNLVDVDIKFKKIFLTKICIENFLKQAIELNRERINELSNSLEYFSVDFSCSYIEIYMKNEKSSNKVIGNLIGRCSIQDLIFYQDKHSIKPIKYTNNTQDSIDTINIPNLDMAINNKIHIRIVLVVNLNIVLQSNKQLYSKIDQIVIEPTVSSLKWYATSWWVEYDAMKIAMKFDIPIPYLYFLYRKSRKIRDILKKKDEASFRLKNILNLESDFKPIKNKAIKIKSNSKVMKIDHNCSPSSCNKKQYVKEFFVEFTMGKFQQSKRLNLKKNFIEFDQSKTDLEIKFGLKDFYDKSDSPFDKSDVITDNFIRFNIFHNKKDYQMDKTSIRQENIENYLILKGNESIINGDNSKMEVGNLSLLQNDDYKNDSIIKCQIDYFNKTISFIFSHETKAKFVICPICKIIKFKHLDSFKNHLENFHVNYTFELKNIDGQKQVIFKIKDFINLNKPLEKYQNFVFHRNKSKKLRNKKSNLADFSSLIRSLHKKKFHFNEDYPVKLEIDKKLFKVHEPSDDITSKVENSNDMNYIFMLKGRSIYSSKTNLEKKINEMEIDSDSEMETHWLDDLTKNMINEFNDVNEGEKRFMILWNLFTTKNECVADCHLMTILNLFVTQEGKNIKKLNLYSNFLLHLANLCDHGLITAIDVLVLVDLLETKSTKFDNVEDILLADKTN